MLLAAHPRIVVVGTSCAGKTTLARQLAQSLGRPHIELDALHWGPKWTPREDFVQQVELAVAADEWIVDGNYLAVRATVWRRATAAVWLNYSFPLILGRALWRTCRRIVCRETLFAGNRESVVNSLFSLEGIPWWVVRTYHRRRRELRGLFQQPEFDHLALLELRHPADAEQVLTASAARPIPSPAGALPRELPAFVDR
jgi:adenylate kinase family enzyme